MSQPSRPTDIVGLAAPSAPLKSTGVGNKSSSSAGLLHTTKLTPVNLNRTILTTPVGRGPASIGQTNDGDVTSGGGVLDHDRLSRMFWKAKHTTVTYCFVFWSFGMCVAFLGPTLLDLGCKTESVFSTMSWVFFAQSLFILIGSATGGLLIHRFSVNPVLFVSTVLLSVTLAIIPMCNALGLLALVLAVMGFFMGTIDTVANVSMIELYGKSVAPFLQALHFFYGLGAFVSPMIAEPFLLNEDCTVFIDNKSLPIKTLEVNATVSANNLLDAQEKTQINYAFWIMALLQIPVIVMVSSLLFKQIYDRLFGFIGDPDEKTVFKTKEEYVNVEMGVNKTESDSLTSVDDDHAPATTTQIYLVTFFTGLLLFLYDGLQSCYGGYIYSYAVKNIEFMTSSEAAYLNAYFWGTFAFGRLVSIVVATKLSPGRMLLCNIVGCLFAMSMMLIWSHNRIALYIGTCLFGAFLSSIYPTAISLAEDFIRVTSGITSCMVMGAASGEMLLPVIVGHQFDRDPINFLSTGFIITTLSLFVYGAIWIVGLTIIRRQPTPGILGALLSVLNVPPSDGASGEETGLVSRNVKYYSRMRHASESSAGAGDDISYGEAIEINHEEATTRR